jgi:ElaA protein
VDRIQTAAFADLDALTLYRLLRLRIDVFVVEQACAYPDLDGRDTEPGALHVWAERHGQPVAYLRVLVEADGTSRIGRVVTAAAHRGDGLAAALVRHAIALTSGPVVLSAQSHLTPWYQSLRFAVDGPQFIDDGIPHTPMRLVREAPASC